MISYSSRHDAQTSVIYGILDLLLGRKDVDSAGFNLPLLGYVNVVSKGGDF